MPTLTSSSAEVNNAEQGDTWSSPQQVLSPNILVNDALAESSSDGTDRSRRSRNRDSDNGIGADIHQPQPSTGEENDATSSPDLGSHTESDLQRADNKLHNGTGSSSESAIDVSRPVANSETEPSLGADTSGDDNEPNEEATSTHIQSHTAAS